MADRGVVAKVAVIVQCGIPGWYSYCLGGDDIVIIEWLSLGSDDTLVVVRVIGYAVMRVM